MSSVQTLQFSAWTLTVLTVVAAVFAWLPSTNQTITPYVVFPLFGLVAFGLMWSHYVTDGLRRYLGLEDNLLRTHFRITSYVVLFCILAHPFLLEFQLYLDGLGLPPQNLLTAYTGGIERLAILAGSVALTCFLVFEFHRIFKNRSWWKYVERGNVGAMVLILWHGFTLGGAFRTPWFQVLWVLYAITFAGAVAYTGYHKRRTDHGRDTHT